MEAAAARRVEYIDLDACRADVDVIDLLSYLLDRAALRLALATAFRRGGVFTACRAASYSCDRDHVRDSVPVAQCFFSLWQPDHSHFRLHRKPHQLRHAHAQQLTGANSSGARGSGVCRWTQAPAGNAQDSRAITETGAGLRLDLDGAALLS